MRQICKLTVSVRKVQPTDRSDKHALGCSLAKTDETDAILWQLVGVSDGRACLESMEHGEPRQTDRPAGRKWTMGKASEKPERRWNAGMYRARVYLAENAPLTTTGTKSLPQTRSQTSRDYIHQHRPHQRGVGDDGDARDGGEHPLPAPDVLGAARHGPLHLREHTTNSVMYPNWTASSA